MRTKISRKKYVDPVGHWNFRICRRAERGVYYYGIHEAHYLQDGSISITVEEVGVGSDEPDGIEWQLRHMQQALTRPILDYETRQRVSERAAIFEMKRPTVPPAAPSCGDATSVVAARNSKKEG